MKQVFNNRELFHVYASGNQTRGRSNNGNVYFEGDTIYSYGAHFPMAIRFKDKMLINNEGYSVTTAKHMSQLRYALRHLDYINMPALRVVQDLLKIKQRAKSGDAFSRQELPRQCASYCKGMAHQINELQGKQERARVAWRKAQYASEIELHEKAAAFVWHEIAGRKSNPLAGALREDKKERKNRLIDSVAQDVASIATANKTARQYALRALRRYKLAKNSQSYDAEYSWHVLFDSVQNAQINMTRRFTSINAGNKEFLTKAMQRDLDSVAAAMQRASDRYLQPLYVKAKAEYDALRALSDAERLERFHAGQIATLPQKEIVCRVRGDNVETSKGASVPLRDALILFNAARVCRKNSIATQRYSNDGQRLGHYRLNQIDAQGNATIGCHYITWQAIEDCARRYMPELLAKMELTQ